MASLKALKDDKSCEAMLAQIEAELLSLLPEAVRQREFQDTAYGVVICYIDLSADQHVPYPVVLWEHHRANCVANGDVSEIWFLPAIESAWQCPMPVSDTLTQRCELVYDYLTRKTDDDEEQIILPFRKMMHRVSLALNRVNWSKILPVTDDFVVMASDWNSAWVAEDAAQSVPKPRQTRLKKKGFFFNPDDLPQPAQPVGCPIGEMGKQPVEQQIPYWMEQLEALIEGKPCDAKRAKWGWQKVTQALCRLDEPGGDALLKVVEKFADLPESPDGQPCKPIAKFATHSEMRCDALKAAAASARRDDSTEKRMWALFDRTLKINKGNEAWGNLPGTVALGIAHMFGDKYNFMVIREYTNEIKNLSEINQQRKLKAPR